jgi:hypothetical protein
MTMILIKVDDVAVVRTGSDLAAAHAHIAEAR